MPGADFEVRFASGERTRCLIRAGALGSLDELATEAGLSGKGALIADERLLATPHGAVLLRYADTRLGRPIARPVSEARKCVSEARRRRNGDNWRRHLIVILIVILRASADNCFK